VGEESSMYFPQDPGVTGESWWSGQQLPGQNKSFGESRIIVLCCQSSKKGGGGLRETRGAPSRFDLKKIHGGEKHTGGGV